MASKSKFEIRLKLTALIKQRISADSWTISNLCKSIYLIELLFLFESSDCCSLVGMFSFNSLLSVSMYLAMTSPPVMVVFNYFNLSASASVGLHWFLTYDSKLRSNLTFFFYTVLTILKRSTRTLAGRGVFRSINAKSVSSESSSMHSGSRSRRTVSKTNVIFCSEWASWLFSSFSASSVEIASLVASSCTI